MAEDDRHQPLSRQSSRKSRSPVMSTMLQGKESSSSPESSNNTGNPSGNPSRSRQLWTRAVESVLEHEETSALLMSQSDDII